MDSNICYNIVLVLLVLLVLLLVLLVLLLVPEAHGVHEQREVGTRAVRCGILARDILVRVRVRVGGGWSEGR